jgi:uncharacterized short protein YbdD (DUF466 family)
MLSIAKFGRPSESKECSPLLKRLAQAGKVLRQTGRLMCGIPDYDGYVAHIRRHHPDRLVPSYEEFFRQRQDARYGRNGNARCC